MNGHIRSYWEHSDPTQNSLQFHIHIRQLSCFLEHFLVTFSLPSPSYLELKLQTTHRRVLILLKKKCTYLLFIPFCLLEFVAVTLTLAHQGPDPARSHNVVQTVFMNFSENSDFWLSLHLTYHTVYTVADFKILCFFIQLQYSVHQICITR